VPAPPNRDDSQAICTAFLSLEDETDCHYSKCGLIKMLVVDLCKHLEHRTSGKLSKSVARDEDVETKIYLTFPNE